MASKHNRTRILDALCRVQEMTELCKRKLAFDIKNAFNTLSWYKILREAEERRLTRQMRTLLGNYLKNGEIIVHNRNEKIRRKVYTGVPQRSILGLLL